MAVSELVAMATTGLPHHHHALKNRTSIATPLETVIAVEAVSKLATELWLQMLLRGVAVGVLCFNACSHHDEVTATAVSSEFAIFSCNNIFTKLTVAFWGLHHYNTSPMRDSSFQLTGEETIWCFDH